MIFFFFHKTGCQAGPFHLDEEDLKFPEVPTETFETMKANLGNLDTKVNSCEEDIERRLTKLKFFNQTWLKDVPETRLSAVHHALAFSGDEVSAEQKQLNILMP